MALKDTLPDWIKPKSNGPKLGLVAKTKPPKLEGDVFEKNQAISQYLIVLSAEIQTNKQNGFTTTIPNETISWLQSNSALSGLQLKSPDLNLYHIGEEIKRLDQILVVQKGELQASQYQAPQDLKAQIQDATTKQLNLQRDINKTLPLLREALAGATSSAKQKELSLLILSSGQYNNTLKRILTSELQSGVSLEVAINNTLIKTRGNSAIGTVIAMANAQTKEELLRKETTKPEDLEDITQKTAEKIADTLKKSAGGASLEQIPQKAKEALKAKFQAGSKANLEKILISSGKTPQEAVVIINQINTQATLGLSPKEIAVLVSTQHQLSGSKDFALITELYSNNVQHALAVTTWVHPISALPALQSSGKLKSFQEAIANTNQRESSPINNYLGAAGVERQTYPTGVTTQTLSSEYEESVEFLIDIGNANIRYFFADPESPPPTSGEFNFEKQTELGGEGLGDGIIKMGAEMFVNAASDKLKEEAALWVVKSGIAASGVGLPFMAAWEVARNMPVVGGFVKSLEKNVLQKGWETAKKIAVVGGAVLGATLIGLGILIGKGLGFMASVAGGAMAGFAVGGPVGGIFGGVGGGLLNYFAPQIGGAASSLWGGLGSLLSSAGSGLSSLAQSFVGGLSSLGGSIASGAGWMVGGTLGIVGATSLLTIITASSTFLTDIAPFGASKYLSLTKTANHTPTKLENDTGSVEVRYTITLKPKNDVEIQSIDRVVDTFSFVSDTQNLTPISSPITPQSFTRDNTGDFVAEYTIIVNTNSYPDTAIINTISAAVTITTLDGQTLTDNISTNARVIIGDPPIEFPYCWPTSGQISQAPNTGHLTLNDSGEAVDIGQSDGNMVYASHDGTIFRDNWGCGYGGVNGGYGNCFAIVSPAGYSTIYGHFDWQNPELTQNSQVEMGDLLGIVGSTGNSTGPHLHYELVGISFTDLNIGSTNVGTNVIESCSGQNQ